MSREALSLEISRVVSRVVSGEAVDTAERGAVLAQKYPELGMSGEMIGEAISRAVGMVGMIKMGGAPAAAVRKPQQAGPFLPSAPFPNLKLAPNGSARGVDAEAETLATEAEIGAELDQAFGTLLAVKTDAPDQADAEATAAEAATGRNAAAARRFAPVAALRRALFRA